MTSITFNDLDEWNPEAFLDDLKAGGYSIELLGLSSGASLEIAKIRPKSQEQEVLSRLFLAGEGVSESEVRQSLPRSYQSIRELGLLVSTGGTVASKLRIRPVDECYVGEDFPRVLGERDDEISTEFVMGVAPTTRMLRRLIPNFPRQRVLDLCCGGGWLALMERGSGAEVVATDLSERCLEVARFNERLAGVEVDWRRGPWFDPVNGETFDLIVSNPPFVQSPGGGSMALDTPSEEEPLGVILGQIGDHLNPGGVGCVLLNWQFGDEEHWDEIPRSLIPGQGLEVLLFEVKRHDPASYAEHWIRQDIRFNSSEKRAAEIERWVEYLRARGSVGVSSGFVLVRKCEIGREWFLSESRELEQLGPDTAEEMRRVFENQAWLKEGDNEGGILDARFEAICGVRKEVVSVLKPEGWEVEVLRLISPGRIMYDGHIDEPLLFLLEELGQGRTARSVLKSLAKMIGVSRPGDLEVGVKNLVGELVGRGLLKPSR
ncbi:MAG: methyltransferase [Verrucomicrobiaceae bacterium]